MHIGKTVSEKGKAMPLSRRSVSSRLLSLLLIVALLSCMSSASASLSDYDEGLTLLEKGQYAEAVTRFEQSGSYRDAPLLLMYARAIVAGENGDYESALGAFEALGSFREAPYLIGYYETRRQEDEASRLLDSGSDADGLPAALSAARSYASMEGVRDSGQRAQDLFGRLYDQASAFLSGGDYDKAESFFLSLGNWRDSQQLASYARACSLDTTGQSVDAARLFAQLGEFRDAASRASSGLETAYRRAATLRREGSFTAAYELYTSLGDYLDSASLAEQTAVQAVSDYIRDGAFEEALWLLDSINAEGLLTPLSSEESASRSSWLDGFVDSYLHFSAGTMEAMAGYNLVHGYIEPGGALDRRFYQVLMIGSYSHNSYYQYYGSELLDAWWLSDGVYAAHIRASASANQPAGPNEVTRSFRILVDERGGSPVVVWLEDSAADLRATGALVASGPLPGGALPADEDGDGIIVIDVVKKGFSGEMIIVLDPSRVFVGMPEFYGGNGMLLEDLVNRYNAIGGINAGGFFDEDGGGSGGLPEGLTIVDGQIYLWGRTGACAAFDQNNVLHVGYYDEESAIQFGFRDCANFGPALIMDGVPEYGDYMETGINPRTAIGQREDGAVLLLVIDGRQIHSIGCSFGDLRDVMLDFGAVNACSLDGGSSTVMYYNGEYMNSPSSASGTSRYLPNAFLIRR